MKYYFFFAFVITGVMISCNNAATTSSVTAEDSLRIITNYQNKMVKLDTMIPLKNLKNFITITKASPDPIPEAEATKMAASYPTHDLGLKGDKGQALKGFTLKDADFSSIITDKDNYKTLSFYFGVRNYIKADAGSEAPEYTLIIVPVRKDGSAAKDKLYDYVLPCPDNCPTNGF